MQIQPGEYGSDGEAAVIANVDAALARFQHSSDPHVRELWSKLCVHRAALRDGTSRAGGSAGTTVNRAPPGPPLHISATDSAERDYRSENDTAAGTVMRSNEVEQRQVEDRQRLSTQDTHHHEQQVAPQQERLVERRQQWAAVPLEVCHCTHCHDPPA